MQKLILESKYLKQIQIIIKFLQKSYLKFSQTQFNKPVLKTNSWFQDFQEVLMRLSTSKIISSKLITFWILLPKKKYAWKEFFSRQEIKKRKKISSSEFKNTSKALTNSKKCTTNLERSFTLTLKGLRLRSMNMLKRRFCQTLLCFTILQWHNAMCWRKILR